MLSLDTIPIYCINLEKQIDNYYHINNIFKQYNLNVIRWNANTPDNINYKFADYLTPQQRACTCSHLNLYNYLIQSNIDVAMILEDDAALRYDWKDIVNNKLLTIQQDDPDWHCLFLNIS